MTMTTALTSPAPAPPPPGPLISVHALVILLLAALAAVGAGVLSHLGGHALPEAALEAGKAFAATLGLGLLVTR